MKTAYQVDFQPIGRRGPCPAGQSLLECAQQLSVELVSICGGVGSCGRCKVQIKTGEVSGLTLEERESLTPKELDEGYRLACQVHRTSDVKVHVPPESLSAPQRTQIEGLEVEVQPDPPVRSLTVRLEAASLDDLRADDKRLLTALYEQCRVEARTIDLHALQTLSPLLRKSGWMAGVAVRGDEVVAVGPPSTNWLGLAVDVGTTKIAGYLVDMESGKTLAARGAMNPQISYGEDIIARIGAAGKGPAEALRFQQLLVDALNHLASELCEEAHKQTTEIVESVVVGNTAIHHLFLRLPVKQLAQSPYVPALRAPVDVKARELRLNLAPGAYVHLLPNIAGYVGADHVAMVLATRLFQADGIVLALDIGTNTEICLAGHGNMISVSCPSGPAFEGAHIKHGMRAAAGAIEHVDFEDGVLKYQTIGGAAPVGICGSGLLDAIAQLYLNGVIDRSGLMGSHPSIRALNGAKEFVLVAEKERENLPAITITQRDVRELQLAKGAIRTGIQVLLESSGYKEDDIDRVIIAGAFGTYIDVSSAITIGMLPRLPLERFEQVGNAAGTGARMALISAEMRAEAHLIADRQKYIELAGSPSFERKFANALYFD